MNDDTLRSIQAAVLAFGEKRNWRQFHTPKNLAMALSVEASELVEIFQWLTPEQSQTLDEVRQGAAEEEVADILMYLLLLCHELNIDAKQAVLEKIAKNESRFPLSRESE